MDHPATRAATDLAYNNNPVIQAHMANVEAARAKRRQESWLCIIVNDRIFTFLTPRPMLCSNSLTTLPQRWTERYMPLKGWMKK
jgi:hypothetical protein